MDIKKKYKVAYFIQDLEIGGAEKLLLQFINELDKNRFEILLFTLDNKGALLKELPSFVRLYSTKNIFKIFRILKKEKPAIFHSHLWRADFIGIPLARLAGIVSCFSTRHNVHYFTGIKSVLIPFDAFIMSLTKAVFSISDAVKYYYKNSVIYKNVNFLTIYNGIDLKRFENLPQKKENRRINLLTVATLTRQKGHVEFLNILSGIKDMDFEWHIVGSGPCENKIRKKIHKYGLDGRVIFHGARKDVEAFYKKADIFILPSLWEGFGLVLLEAMSSNIPVFASNVDGIAEILKNNETAILFDWKDIPQAINDLRQILSKRDLQEKLIKNAKEESKKYDIKKMVKSYIEKYDELREEFN